MPGSMLWPLLSMLLGFMLFFGAVLCMRLQGEVLNRERQAKWVREAVNRDGNGFWSMGGYARYVWPCFAFACRHTRRGIFGPRAAICDARATAAPRGRCRWRRVANRMTPRRKRLFVVLGILGRRGRLGVAGGHGFAREHHVLLRSRARSSPGKAPLAKRFRIGGMVVKGSVARKPGDLEVRFVLTDFAHEVPVEYTGVLPDLFREGQGIIAHGTLNSRRDLRGRRSARQTR